MVQDIKKLSIKIDDRSLANGMYQSGRDRQSTQPTPQQPPPRQPPPHQTPPYQPPPHHPPLRYPLQHPQFNEFFYEKKFPISSINTMILKMIMKMKGWFIEGE